MLFSQRMLNSYRIYNALCSKSPMRATQNANAVRNYTVRTARDTPLRYAVTDQHFFNIIRACDYSKLESITLESEHERTQMKARMNDLFDPSGSGKLLVSAVVTGLCLEWITIACGVSMWSPLLVMWGGTTMYLISTPVKKGLDIMAINQHSDSDKANLLNIVNSLPVGFHSTPERSSSSERPISSQDEEIF